MSDTEKIDDARERGEMDARVRAVESEVQDHIRVVHRAADIELIRVASEATKQAVVLATAAQELVKRVGAMEAGMSTIDDSLGDRKADLAEILRKIGKPSLADRILQAALVATAVAVGAAAGGRLLGPATAPDPALTAPK